MNVKIVSDLHLEYYKENYPISTFIDLENSKNSMLILAGDIGSIYKYFQLRSFIKECVLNFKYVIYVLGNHEYYYKHSTIYKKDIQYLKNKIMSLQLEFNNLYILDNDSIIIGSYCFLGTTLWCNPETSVPKHIKIHDFTTKLVNEMYNDSVNYIHEMIEYCKEKSLKLIVISHYSPISIIKTKEGKENLRETKHGEWYVNNLDHLLNSKYIHTWICGHIHRCFDYYTNLGTRFIGNQKGKGKGLVENYSEKFSIFID
jgi:Icc-related predicted phosphoesterase